MAWVKINNINVAERIEIEEKAKAYSSIPVPPLQKIEVGKLLSHSDTFINPEQKISVYSGVNLWQWPDATPTAFFSVTIFSSKKGESPEQIFYRSNKDHPVLVRGIEYSTHCEVKVGDFIPESPGDEIAILAEGSILIGLYRYVDLSPAHKD